MACIDLKFKVVWKNVFALRANKEVDFYKSVSWHVHSLNDMTDGYIIFNCVRTRGRDDARRRAED